MKDNRTKLLDQWYNAVAAIAKAGALGRNVQIYRGSRAIAGPRAGVLELLAGIDNEGSHAGRMLSALGKNDFALHRQLVPWDFAGEPAVFMSGRYVRLEAGWPEHLAEKNIPLSSIPVNPHAANPEHPGQVRWIIGKNELGHTVTIALSDRIPHILVGGMTGSGKTVEMRSALGQMAKQTAASPGSIKFVLIDAKFGTGFRAISQHLTGQVGPMAETPDQARDALGWASTEMTNRLVNKGRMSSADWEHVPPLIIAIDEIQELTRPGMDANTEMLRKLAAQGREAKVHLIVGTQHPIIEAFGDSSIKRNIAAGVIALKVNDSKASEVVVGAPDPRADRLLGAGDAYIIAPGATYRTQVAYLSDAEIMATPGQSPELPAWPEFQAENAVQWNETGTTLYDAQEVAISVISANVGEGRDRLKNRFETAGLTKPGSPKARRLRDYGRAILDHLRGGGYRLCPEQVPTIGEDMEDNEPIHDIDL